MVAQTASTSTILDSGCITEPQNMAASGPQVAVKCLIYAHMIASLAGGS